MQTAGDARAAVRQYQREHGHVVKPKQSNEMSEAELAQQWGKELFDGLMGGGR